MDPIVLLSNIFDYLIKEFEEDPSTLPLFIQNFTQGGSSPWQIISRTRGPLGYLRISPNTMTYEFFKVDEVQHHQANLNRLLDQARKKKENAEARWVEQMEQKMRGPNREFKNGDMFEFGTQKSEWRDITPIDPIAQYHKNPGFIGLNPDGSLTKPWAGKLGDR